MELPAIYVSVVYISRENTARNRNLDGQKFVDDTESHLFHIHLVELRDHVGRKSLALQHVIKAVTVSEHDVECQLKRPSVFAANQFCELPKFAQFVLRLTQDSQEFHFHGKWLTWIIQFPHMVDAEAVNRSSINSSGRKWISQIAD